MSRFGNVVFAGLAAAAVVSAFAFAQGGRGSAPTTAATSARPTYFQDVGPILQGRCISCHNLKGIGPFKLTTYQDAVKHRSEIAAAVTRRIMPPWRAERGVRSYLYDPSLTETQIQTIRRWVAQGARKGNPAKPRPPLQSVVHRGGMSRVDMRLSISTPFTPKGDDDYHCFVLPWRPVEARYISGLQVYPGQPRQVHHSAVILLGASIAPAAEAADAADPRPGYDCSGQMAPVDAQFPAQLLGPFPGAGFGADLPRGTGVRVGPGDRLVLQVHYNAQGRPMKPDRSAVGLKLDRSVARPSTWIAVLDPKWLSGGAFRIPAGKKDIAFSFSGDPSKHLVFRPGELDLSRGFRVYASGIHMHQLGSRASISIVRGSRRETLVSIRSWDFKWQFGYYFKQSTMFRAGDRLRLECRYDNTAANQPTHHAVRQRPQLVTWGERSIDEMCVGYLYVSEP